VDKDYVKVKLGINIRVARKAKGYSQEELAPKIGVSRSQLTNIENGTTGTTIDKIIKLSELLEIDVKDLLNLDIQRCPTCNKVIEN